MKKIVLMAAAAVVAAGAGAYSLGRAPEARAADPAPAANQCIETASLESKMVVAKNQLLLEDSYGHAALVTLSPPCSQMDQLDHIGFIYQGDTRLCQKHDIKILYSRESEHPVQCLIEDVKPLTKDEAKAYSSSSSSSAH